MKRLGLIGGLMVLLLAACTSHSETRHGTSLPHASSPELAAIDSLMWRQPDSALAVLQQFAASSEADSLNEFNEHYCQLLISELLYKNDYGQSNRPALQQAVAYFDSLILTLKDTPTLKRLIAGTDPLSLTRNDNIHFLTARAHYINGVGYYERDSVVDACKEYLKALEVMEGHFEGKELVGERARFMALTFTRLTGLFSDYYLSEQAILLGKYALEYYRKYDATPWHIAWILDEIGSHYEMKSSYDNAYSYYEKAASAIMDTCSLMYRDIHTHKAMIDYKTGKGSKTSLTTLQNLIRNSKDEQEQLARYLVVGEIFYSEKQYDSAQVYLNAVFLNSQSVGAKKQAAEWLVEICKAQGSEDNIIEYAGFLVPFATQDENNGMIKSQLAELYNTHKQQELGQQHHKETSKHVNRTLAVVAGMLFMILTISLLNHKNRRHKQDLESLIETERHTHKMQQSALSNRLKRSNEELRELKGQIRQQADSMNTKQEAQALSFNDEPICRLIMERVNDGQFKAKIDCEIYKQYALDKQQLLDLRVAADRHFTQFTIRLRNAYPRLTSIDIDYCCLNLLNLTHADISALMQRAYNTVVERDSKIQKVFDTEKPLHVFLMDIAQHYSSI